jgi:anti-anti-sigma regulatory factor
MALRITIEENEQAVIVKLEGRIVGPWAAELDRLWEQTSPNLAERTLSLDLRNTTFADAGGIQVLKAIYSQTDAEILTSTPWTQYLAEEIMRKTENLTGTEA